MGNIIKHELIPEHIKLSAEEKKKLLKNNSFTTKILPKIIKTDFAIASMSPKVGDIIKIQRPSPTAGVAVYYRVVVE